MSYQSNSVPSAVRCPSCDGVDVRRSYPQGLRDAIMIRTGRPPLRCRGCNYRWYRRLRANERLGRPDVSREKAPIL
jgi:hypothetical protein